MLKLRSTAYAEVWLYSGGGFTVFRRPGGTWGYSPGSDEVPAAVESASAIEHAFWSEVRIAIDRKRAAP